MSKLILIADTVEPGAPLRRTQLFDHLSANSADMMRRLRLAPPFELDPVRHSKGSRFQASQTALGEWFRSGKHKQKTRMFEDYLKAHKGLVGLLPLPLDLRPTPEALTALRRAVEGAGWTVVLSIVVAPMPHYAARAWQIYRSDGIESDNAGDLESRLDFVEHTLNLTALSHLSDWIRIFGDASINLIQDGGSNVALAHTIWNKILHFEEGFPVTETGSKLRALAYWHHPDILRALRIRYGHNVRYLKKLDASYNHGLISH